MFLVNGVPADARGRGTEVGASEDMGGKEKENDAGGSFGYETDERSYHTGPVLSLQTEAGRMDARPERHLWVNTFSISFNCNIARNM